MRGDYPKTSRVLPGASTVIKTGPSLFLRAFLEHRKQGLIASCLCGPWNIQTGRKRPKLYIPAGTALYFGQAIVSPWGAML